MKPTQPHERYDILDILRGFALIGVLVANMTYHSGYFFLEANEAEALPFSEIDHQVLWWVHLTTEGKFYTIFSLLFGIGFALQIKRSEADLTSFAKYYRRRLIVLFCIGLLHAIFFFVGDILTVYALLGFVLLFFKRSSNKSLLRAAFIFILLPIVQYVVLLITISPTETMEAIDTGSIIKVYQSGSFFEIVKTNMGGIVLGRYPQLLFTGRFFRVLAMFLVGFFVTRKMLYADLEKNKKFLLTILVTCLFIGVPCNIILANTMETGAYENLGPSGVVLPLVYAFGVPSLGIAYSIIIFFSYQKYAIKPFLKILAPVGQLALTNYIMQSVIAGLMFSGYGLGYYGSVGPTRLMFLAGGIYIFQVVFSFIWLQYFRYGPFEYIWRVLTYKKWLCLRNKRVVFE